VNSGSDTLDAKTGGWWTWMLTVLQAGLRGGWDRPAARLDGGLIPVAEAG
jgi:hypothetical protein